MEDHKIVERREGLYTYLVLEDMEQRWWNIQRPGDETPAYFDEYDGREIAELLSFLHEERDKYRAEVERLREERSQLLDALRELYDFSGQLSTYRDRSTNAFERALEVLQRLEARED